MPRPAFRLFGSTELEIMTILWEHGPGTVREVMRAIQERRPVAYTTVMTVLTRLADKGLLPEEGTRQPGYIYTPLVTKEQVIALAVREMLTDLQPTAPERRRALLALTA